MTQRLTVRSALAYVEAHPGCTINDILEAHGMPLDTTIDEDEYFDREGTGSAILGWLAENRYVTYVVTSFDGWQYTSTGQVWR